MYREDLFYPRYSNFRYNSYYPNFNPTYNSQYVTYDEICNETNKSDDLDSTRDINLNDNTNFEEIKGDNNDDTKSRDLGDAENRQISFMGFSFALDDLILVVLIFLLFMESENNLALIVILGLMLFNINLSSLNLF